MRRALGRVRKIITKRALPRQRDTGSGLHSMTSMPKSFVASVGEDFKKNQFSMGVDRC
jgi:hypothetical protein